MQARSLLKLHVFMNLAFEISRLSTCPRRQVGCVILDKNNRVLSIGYNGAPKGLPHCEVDCGREATKDLNACIATHAEMNAILNCRAVQEMHTMYTTTSPCRECAKLICNSSIKHIVYYEEYDFSAIEMLYSADIECSRYYLCNR